MQPSKRQNLSSSVVANLVFNVSGCEDTLDGTVYSMYYMPENEDTPYSNVSYQYMFAIVVILLMLVIVGVNHAIDIVLVTILAPITVVVIKIYQDLPYYQFIFIDAHT